MISSAISADLGRQELIQGSSEALATVTGIVDGTGSIGAAVGQVRTGGLGSMLRPPCRRGQSTPTVWATVGGTLVLWNTRCTESLRFSSPL